VTNKRQPTYESEALFRLAYEFSFSKKEETDTEIKSALKRKKLGGFDAKRIAVLRQLKDELQSEIHKWGKSDYFTHNHSQHADPQDFDVPRLAGDMIRKYPTIPKEEIENFVPYAIYVYYLR